MFVMDRIFEGVCRPFKVRLEQVLQSRSSLIILYKLSNTLEFYSHAVSEFIGRETALSDTLWTLKDAAQKTFFDIMKTRGEKLLWYPPDFRLSSSFLITFRASDFRLSSAAQPIVGYHGLLLHFGAVLINLCASIPGAKL